MTRRGYRSTSADTLMRYARALGYGDTHIKVDKKTGLTAIIAIHNLTRGPAIGGCRFVHYDTMAKAYEDALRLGYMMSYKAAINLLPHGGAKAVLIKPKVINDREAYFEKYGEFVNELGGRYITAVDSGTTPWEMDIIARRTPYVTCTTNSDSANDPSPLTALGVRRGIEAAVKYKLGKDSLHDIHVSIQGVGHVGYYLAKELHALGAKLTVADVNIKAIERCVDEFGAAVCHDPSEIYDVPADVFAPCALGAIINLNTISRLRVGMVVGSANNQLAHHLYAQILHEKGILYAPDFLVNAGGLIHVAVIYGHGSVEQSVAKINAIYDRSLEIFEQSARDNLSTDRVAMKIARERLG